MRSRAVALPVAGVGAALADLDAGRMVAVCDLEFADAASEGSLVVAAERVTPAALGALARDGSSWTYLALTAQRCQALGLKQMESEEPGRTAFTVTIDAREGIGTGVTLADQTHTIRTAIDPACGRRDVVFGGHVRPLRARQGGVLERPYFPEAGIDLARLAGLLPAAVICHVLSQDGDPLHGDALRARCARLGVRAVTLSELVAHRRAHDTLVAREVATALPTRAGTFEAIGYRGLADSRHYLALVMGEVVGRRDVPVSVHVECMLGNVFGSHACRCRARLDRALETVARARAGVVVYLARAGDGPVLGGHGAGEHDDAVTAQILRDLGVASYHRLDDREARCWRA